MSGAPYLDEALVSLVRSGPARTIFARRAGTPTARPEVSGWLAEMFIRLGETERGTAWVWDDTAFPLLYWPYEFRFGTSSGPYDHPRLAHCVLHDHCREAMRHPEGWQVAQDCWRERSGDGSL